MFMNGNRYRKELLTINCIFIEILYNFETLPLLNKSPPQAPLRSGFCTDPPPLKMTKIFGRTLTESTFVKFGGPAGGSAPGKLLRFTKSYCCKSCGKSKMIRRAFLSLRVLILCNSAAREIGSEKCSPFLHLSNLLFNLVAFRSENHIKPNCVLTILKTT